MTQIPSDADIPRPTIEFPCEYPIHVVGDAKENFLDVISEVIARHCEGFEPSHVTLADSRNGRFQSARVKIHATSEAQLQSLFNDLKATGLVHMVL